LPLCRASVAVGSIEVANLCSSHGPVGIPGEEETEKVHFEASPSELYRPEQKRLLRSGPHSGVGSRWFPRASLEPMELFDPPAVYGDLAAAIENPDPNTPLLALGAAISKRNWANRP